MTTPRILTPETILNLLSAIRWEGTNQGSTIRDTLALSAESRDQCRHLLYLFDKDHLAHTTLWDVYLAHYRWEGQRRWQQWEKELVPGNLKEAFARLEQAPRPLLWGLVEGLCETSRRLARSDCPTAEALGHQAVQLARKAPLDVLDSQCRDELTALAFATLANAYRVQDKVRKARVAMDLASTLLNRAPSHPLGLTAVVLSLRASLECWERRYVDSLDTLQDALALVEPSTLWARIQVQIGYLCVCVGKPLEALDHLQNALGILDPAEDSHLWLCATQNQLWVLTEIGRHHEALELLPDMQRLALEVAGSAEKLRMRWVEARLAVGQDHIKEAEALYSSIQHDFLDAGLTYSAALVTLELARLLFDQGRLEEVKAQVVSTLAEFQRQQVEPELIGALALLEEAALGQRLTLELLRQARQLIERQETRPRG